jgi:lipid-binding SYLF domain-containing protein
MAANSAANSASSPATNSHQATAQRVVDESANTIQELQSNADFQKLMKQAKGVFIVPELVKGAAIVGGSGGTGALLVRNNGQWSDPAFLTIGSISIGPQVGGKAGPVAMFLMTDKAVANFTTHNNFSLNGKAALTIVNFSRTGEASLGKGDVVVWSGTSGLFAGFNISGSDVVADAKDDQAYYNNKNAGTKQIIDRQLTNAQADKLVTKLPT